MSVLDRIRQERLVAIVRRAADVDARVAALADAGVGVIEITLDDPDGVGCDRACLCARRRERDRRAPSAARIRSTWH